MAQTARPLIPRGYRTAAVAIAVGLVVFLAAVGTALAGQMQALRHGGAERTYYLHVPDGLKPGAPLLFVLHGAGGSGERAVRQYSWQSKADAEGFIVAGPEASQPFAGRPADFRTNPRVWNDGSGRGGPNVRGSDDVGFIAALIEVLARRHGIDRSRVYVTGFSSGAGMTQRLGQEMAERIAAIAPVAGIMVPLRAALPRPMPVLYVSGDSDPLNPLEGGDIALPWGGRFHKEPIGALIERWRDLDGCTGSPAVSASAALTVQRWLSCRDGVEVHYALVHGHGHEWPGSEPSRLPSRVVGPVHAGAYDATAAAWRFLQRWQLR